LKGDDDGVSPPRRVASKGKDEEGLPLFVAFVLRGGREGNNPLQSRHGRTSQKEEERGGTLPIGVMSKEKDEEGVDPPCSHRNMSKTGGEGSYPPHSRQNTPKIGGEGLNHSHSRRIALKTK